MNPAAGSRGEFATGPADTVCVFGVCFSHNVGGWVVLCSAGTRRCLVVNTGLSIWFLVQL